jgi:hypothetical protein
MPDHLVIQFDLDASVATAQVQKLGLLVRNYLCGRVRIKFGKLSLNYFCTLCAGRIILGSNGNSILTDNKWKVEGAFALNFQSIR